MSHKHPESIKVFNDSLKQYTPHDTPKKNNDIRLLKKDGYHYNHSIQLTEEDNQFWKITEPADTEVETTSHTIHLERNVQEVPLTLATLMSLAMN